MEAPQDLTGTMVGRFAIRARLGSGGMGEVYRADDTKLKRSVALKRIASRVRTDERYRQRFLKEAERASRLTDQHIAQVYDVFEADKDIFLVMEYVEGQTLRQCLGQPLGVDRFLEIAVQCAKALDAAHQRNIIHCDIKPENIMLTPVGQVKILDFGIARELPRAGAGASTVTLATEAGMLRGTVAYMAPEVLMGKEADGRADIFSLGVVFYEALTGRHPFLAETFAATSDRVLHQAPAPLRELNPSVPPELDRIVTKMLAKEPTERYLTAQAVVRELRALVPDDSRGQRGERNRHLRRPAAAIVSGLALAAILVGLNVRGWRDRLLGRAGLTRIESVAVLPLENLSGNPEQDYFADGMTDALITDLSQISALRVISRTSVMHYKDTRKPLPQIARELNVDAVVEGSVLRSGNRVRISAQLIHGASDKHLWAKSYERDLRDVLTLQSEVASTIANEIRITVTPQERVRLTSAARVNPAAQEAYFKGNYLNKGGTYEQRRKARDYFEQAVGIDPSYAPAYAGLADYYWATTELHPQIAMPKAKQYALKALELDPSLAQVYTTLAAVRLYADWDWAMSEKEFRRAIELNPSYAEGHRMYSIYLSALGRVDEAQAEVHRAQELDPFATLPRITSGWVFYFARQYDQAVEHCQKALELEPNSVNGHACLSSGYLAKGMYDQAIAASRRAVALSGGDPVREVGLGRAYALAGRKAEARKVLGELRQLSKDTYVPPYYLATLHAALGEKERALAWLEKAYRERDRYMAWLKVDDALDLLRPDPRFQELLRRVGFPP